MLPMDPLLIEQVLINLLENALVHSGSNAPVELVITEEKDTITFQFHDHGKGIDVDILPELLSGHYEKPPASDAHRGHGDRPFHLQYDRAGPWRYSCRKES